MSEKTYKLDFIVFILGRRRVDFPGTRNRERHPVSFFDSSKSFWSRSASISADDLKGFKSASWSGSAGFSGFFLV